LSRYEQDLEESKEKKLKKITGDLYVLIRKLPFKDQDLIEEFHPKALIRLTQQTLFATTEETLNQKYYYLKSLLANLEQNSNNEKMYVRILQHFDRLKETLLKEESKEDIIRNALKKTFFSEFYSEITPKSNRSSTSKIVISEGENKIVEIAVRSNDVYLLRLFDDLFFDDATFIESPIYLQLYSLIRYADTLLDNNKELSKSNKVALHIKDLISKMENVQFSPFFDMFTKKLHQLEQKILNIINGKGFQFSLDEDDFLFYRTEDLTYRPINTASGVKTFGIIQLLLNAEILGERHPLIIDEPETHLHPAWQVKYAEMIVELVKYGIPVILTSHSPYIVQALKFFSEKGEITSQTHFYLAERTEDNMSVISEVTDDLSQIFSKLSKPLRELVWT
jgi:predicted ATP-dependent endonuclease of OLD family